MAQPAVEVFSAKEAIVRAREVFDDLFAGSAVRYVLLDGVEYLEDSDQWMITIGFDIGRQSTSGLGVFDPKKTPIREQRHIFLDADGNFIKMT